MKKSLILSGFALVALSSSAQYLKEGYITWPDGAQLPTVISNWSLDNPTVTEFNGTSWDDENFFISRVKIKPYITNVNTQVYENITESNDKKLLMWVPVGNVKDVNGIHSGSLPNGVFDSEVFSMWPYVTYYGDWIPPYGWIPGGFADAAHKHGTAVAGQASIPNATLSGNWYNCVSGMGTNFMTDEGAKKVAAFLNYHGVDGLNYNSEFSTTQSIVTNLSTMHGKVYKYMHETYGNDKFENIWYTGTVASGGINFNSSLHSGNLNIFGNSSEPRTSLFVNYEWLWYINTTNNNLPGTGRDGRDLYMGMNMQAGCKDANEWLTHKTTNYSIGLWGALDFNYLWAPRANNGSRDDQKQVYYQQRLEEWFSNGNRNPANRIDVYATTSLGPSAEWFGMSQFMSARSTLGWDIADEPFVSFFNLGNGKFFNWKGERQNNNPWYNIGVQDYMPTWRFWFATELLGNTPEQVAEDGLKAEFTWDDAYVGGSCLSVKGTTDSEYLHLFKTEFELNEGDVITVRYKLMGGSANVNLVLTGVSAEFNAISEEDLNIINSENTPDDGEWSVKSFKVGDVDGLDGTTVALLGLHFEDAENLELFLGELSIKSASATATPAAPIIDKNKTKVLGYNMNGVDGKIIFNMANNKAAGEPVYNNDVNTSMFKLYAQYQNGKEQFMGLTTSWAGMLFAVPADVDNVQKVRFGVSAVSLDTDSESEIVWSDWMDAPAYETSNNVEINKQVIKPGESFTVKYSDPKHTPATWAIYNSNNQKVASSNGNAVSFTCDGLSEIGGYDLVINEGYADEVRFAYFIQVTAKSTGALPEIQSLTINDVDAEADNAEVSFNINDEFTLGYTGREADGSASRGIVIDNKFVGGPVSDLGIQGGAKNFSMAYWVKYEFPEGSSRLFGVEDRTVTWPVNNWGWCWFNVGGSGQLENMTFRSSTTNGSPELKYDYSNVTIPNGAWTHIAYTFEWNASNQFRAKLYINGKLQTPKIVSFNGKDGDLETFWSATNKGQLGTGMWFYFAGGAGSSPVFNDGVIDDIVVWDGVMTEAEVQQVMAGVDAAKLPENVMAYWDLESDADETAYTFAAVGSKAGARFSNYDLLDLTGEGQAKPTPIKPTYEAGSPFIGGSSYPVVTKPEWSVRKIATVSEAEGNDKAGSAKISLPRKGDYTVKLILENSHGSDAREYPVFTIKPVEDAIEVVGAEGEGVAAYTVNGTLFVEFDNDGAYTVNVYNVNGQLVGQKAQNIAAGQNMAISLANSGVYVINVVKDGKVVRNLKVLNQK